MRVLNLSTQKEINNLMRDINVDSYGIKIMSPKARFSLLKINSLSNVAANILKQEMLSLGGEVALSRDALTGKAKQTDCLLMGSLSQLSRLSRKLNKQPFGLTKIAENLDSALNNYQRNNFHLKAAKFNLNLGVRSYIMGIVNVTPDSFSHDGLFGLGQDEIIEYALKLIKDGADIIDIGGESSRFGSDKVSLKEELSRVVPVIKKLAKKINIPISVDTCKPEVAKAALDNGASIINDISGLKNIKMAKVVASFNAAIIIMHMLGNPRTMQIKPNYNSLIDEIADYLSRGIDRAMECKVGADSIVIDPGIGFGKRVSHNLEILKRLREFKSLGKPILVGTSRKSFIGKILKVNPEKRVFGTVASSVYASINGADILRVHDVRAVKEALLVSDSIKK